MITTSLGALAALRVATDVRNIEEQDLAYCSAPVSPSRAIAERPLQISTCVSHQLDVCGGADMANVIIRLQHFEVPPLPLPLVAGPSEGPTGTHALSAFRPSRQTTRD